MNQEIFQDPQRYPYPTYQTQLHQSPSFHHQFFPYLNPQILHSLRDFQPAPCPMIQGIRRPRPEPELPGYSGIDAKRSRSGTHHGISPISMPVPTSLGDEYLQPGGAPEHSQGFQDLFEAEDDDDKADLHADHCSTNRPVDLTLGKDEERSEKVIQMTDPLTQIVFEIKASQLSQVLQKNGKTQIKIQCKFKRD